MSWPRVCFRPRAPAVQAAPEAALAPGDIAILGFNFDTPDNFAFVTLVDIQAGTQITFTDAGWRADTSLSSFCSGEGGDTWTAPADLPAGTVITHYINGVINPDFQVAEGWTAGINPQAPSDQIIAFTGTKDQPLPIYALNNTNAGGWQLDCTNAHTSALPTGLIDGQTAVAFSLDNAVYAGPTTGTREELLAAISNPDNWLKDDNLPFDFSIRFPPGGGGGLEIDNLPWITGVVPGSEAVDVPLDANIQVTFSEPVTTAADWFTIGCGTSGVHTAQVSASGSTYTLNPNSNFHPNETCTVTINGPSVSDQDGNPHTMSSNYTWSFTTIPPVVFRYHDLEGVVQAGEKLFIAGDFNSWDPAADELTPLGGGLFSANVEIPAYGTYEYRYYILPAGSSTPVDGLLDSTNRSAVFDSLPEQFDDYRSVAALDAFVSPSTVSINQGGSMPDFYGQISMPGVTDRAGAGRGLKVDFGSGQDGQIAAWVAWSAMTYLEDQGSDDRFTFQPAVPAPGQYYYGIRFDANWGDGNPNAGWTYAGATGIVSAGGGTDPVLEDPGELTITAPDLVLEKTVLPASGVDLGDTVTYTLLLTNQGDGAATGVELSDTLPASLAFGNITSTEGVFDAGEVSWSGDIPPGESVEVVFTATLVSQASVDVGFVSNTAAFTAANNDPGEDTVTFNTVAGPDLAITKKVSQEAGVMLGDGLTYTITLTNSGDGNALNVVLTDPLPEGLTFGTIIIGGATFSSGAVQWSGQVNAGQTVTVVFTATVNQNEGLFGQTLTNTASYTSSNAGEGQAQAAFMIQPKPIIYLPFMFK